MGEVAFVAHYAVSIIFEVSALLGLVLGVVDLGVLGTLVAVVRALVVAHLLAHTVADLVGGDVLLLRLILLVLGGFLL